MKLGTEYRLASNSIYNNIIRFQAWPGFRRYSLFTELLFTM